MSYQDALTAAGAIVHAFEQFGSYQGDWYAKVTLPDGREGYIHDYYGSCSGCDAFEADVGYDATPEVIAAFGRRYFDQLITYEQALLEAAEHQAYDLEADAVIKWLKEQHESPLS